MNYVLNLNPFAIQFTEHFGVRWYGLAYLSGFLFGYYAILLMVKRGNSLFKVDQIADFVTYVAIGVLVGGRLGYATFYAPDLWTSVDNHFPYWGVLKVNEGGMASHGGILGVMLVCFLYGRKHKMGFLHCLDLTVLGSSIGFFFGRIANFINGELFGREASASFRWAVKFPAEMNLWAQRDPEKLMSLKDAAGALGSFKSSSGEVVALDPITWSSWAQGFTRGMYRNQVYEAMEAMVQAVQAGNTKVTEALSLVLTSRHASQLYQAVLEGLLVFVLLVFIWRKPQKPGVLGAWFGTLYCTARIIGEQFRMPDAQIGFQWLGLTRGQWLSIAMLSVAIVFLIYAYRRKAVPIGGWQAQAKA